MKDYGLSDLLDLAIIQKMADAHYRAAGMPIGIIDAIDGSVLIGSGWQDICVKFHRANPLSFDRCRDSDNYIKDHLVQGEACHYKCQNGLWDIGVPVVVAERHLATLFLGQFFYEGEAPDRESFIRQAHEFDFDVNDYLAALDRVPVFSREKVDTILEYDKALVAFIADLAEHALFKIKADEKIRESERKFRAVFDQAYQFIGLLSIDGRMLEANRTALAFAGIEEADVIGRPFWGTPWWTHSPELQEKIRLAVQAAAKGELIRFEASHPAVDGDPHYVDFSLKPVEDEAGRVIMLMLEGRDITERKKAERSLAESEAKTRSILDNIGIGVALISPRMEILELNRRMREWFPAIDPGQRPICYQSLNDPPRQEVCDYCPTCKTLQDGLVHETTTQTPRPDGTRNYRIVSSPILDPSGRITAAIEMVEDITERLSLESQLRQAQKMESVGRLAGGIAHDFNNMLGVIIGHTELALNRMDSTQPFFAPMQGIQNAALRSADLTRQLLAFARKQTVSPRVLNLNQTVESMLKMLRRLIGEDIDLVWLPAPGLWPVKMDPSQVDQLLANLCVNARDAIAGVGKITIETHTVTFDEAYCANHAGFVPGDFVMLAVSDNGLGMDKETLDKIFEPFFTTKGIGKGTGLGLATAYGVVKQNNGFINVYSEANQGSVFKIYLPRHAAKSEETRKKTQVAPDAQGNETILLVEDEISILEIVRLMLEKLGYRILAASTPGEAITLAKEHVGEIHLLLTDVIMPEMNGRDLAQTLISLYPGLRCLFTSGYTSDVMAHHGVLDDGINFIAKPFSLQTLAAKVREVLDSEI
jgi:two-component system, cell cycle sensor histidine kinase and response regulator CckA